MERIVIEVNKDTAAKWEKISTARRKKISALVTQVLSLTDEPKPTRPTEKDLMKLRKKNLAGLSEYKGFLDKIGNEAAANGLTEEILDELLKKDD